LNASANTEIKDDLNIGEYSNFCCERICEMKVGYKQPGAIGFEQTWPLVLIFCSNVNSPMAAARISAAE
jgi:hypothetical protein